MKVWKKNYLPDLIHYSDKPGNHDFKILKKLVLPNGSVLRARFAGRPTRDCLFEDPVMDGKRYVTCYNLSLRMARIFCFGFILYRTVNTVLTILQFAENLEFECTDRGGRHLQLPRSRKLATEIVGIRTFEHNHFRESETAWCWISWRSCRRKLERKLHSICLQCRWKLLHQLITFHFILEPKTHPFL